MKQSVVKAVGMKAQSRRNGGISLLSRKYHSYPDPNEKAQISTFVSKTTEKQIDKSSGIFSLKNDFKLDTAFPGVPLHQGISDKGAPVVHQTKLPNGLLVASNELPGSFMVTLGFLVKCGRYIKSVRFSAFMCRLIMFHVCFHVSKCVRGAKWRCQ